MCFLVIIGAVLVFAAFYVMSVGMLAILAVIFLILVIVNANKYSKSKRYTANKKICPACYGTNIQFNIINSGAESSTWNYSEKWSETHTKFSNQKIAICTDCGHSFNYATDSDVLNMQAQSKKALISSCVMLAVVACALIYSMRM